MKGITSRMPAAEYFALPGVSITRLKELKRSPQHYRHQLEHPKQSPSLSLGTAAHCAVLEPERFAREFAVWSKRTASGNLAPRNSAAYTAFCEENEGRTIITEDEYIDAMAMCDAVRSHAAAMMYLETGDPEVTLQWELGGRACKGRVDWLTRVESEHVLVGLKSARDCRHMIFGTQAARLGYHLQWAWYHDGYEELARVLPRVVEIVVESAPPYAVAVYAIPEDVLLQGRDEYRELIEQLGECERTGVWAGPHPLEEQLTLPSWAYPHSDELNDIGLEA